MALDTHQDVAVPIEERFARALTETPEAAPEKPAAEAAPKPEENPVVGASDAEISSLLEEIQSLSKQLEAPEPAKPAERPVAKVEDDALTAALASDDPEKQALARTVNTLRQKLDGVIAQAEERATAERTAADEQANTDLEREQVECVQKYGLTKIEFKDAMTQWAKAIKQDERYAVYTFEEVLGKIHGWPTLLARQRTPGGPEKANGSTTRAPATGPAPARVVDQVSTGNGPDRGKPSRPEVTGDFQQTKDNVLERVFGIPRES